MLSSYLIPFAFLLGTVYGNGQLTILHHPASLVFKGHDTLRETVLQELYASSLGFSTEQYSNWNGLFIQDPFNLAEAVVTIAVDGLPNIGHSKGHHYPLKTDEDESEIYSSLERRITERYPEGDNQLVRVNLADGLQDIRKANNELFKKIKHDKLKKHAHFKLAVDEDREFLKEISLLNDIIDLLETESERIVLADNQPDIYWFKIGSLHALADLYGENSTQVKEAKQMLNEAAIRLSNVFSKLYNGKVMVSIVTSDAVHTRRSRNVLQAADESENWNLAKNYSPNYPVVFNIILWFGVVMVFALLAICVAIAEMDPGRDSIIYRMTSTRLKKD